MSERGFTRRSLLAAAGVAAGGLALPRGARARTGLNPADPGIGRVGPSAADAVALALIPPTLPAGPGQPPMVAREAWARGGCLPRVTPAYGVVRMAFVHHTENPNGYLMADVPRMLRAIFLFHRDGKGWNDIGYNFVVDRFGRIFEARAGGVEEAVVGAQAGGYNYCSTGVAVLGEYGARRISPQARVALAHLLAWKLSLHGVPLAGRVRVRVNPAGAVYSRFPAGAQVWLPRVAGHRDADSTSCPGDALYGELPGLRLAAGGLAGHPARLTMGVRSDEATEAPVALAGALAFLEGGAGAPGGGVGGAGGTPISGAPVEIQARSVARRGEVVRERTLAQAQTAADGSFAVPMSLAQGGPGMWLRALCPGAVGVPAAVSEPVHLGGMVSFTATPPPPSGSPPSSPPPTGPTPSPPPSQPMP